MWSRLGLADVCFGVGRSRGPCDGHIVSQDEWAGEADWVGPMDDSCPGVGVPSARSDCPALVPQWQLNAWPIDLTPFVLSAY